MREGAGSAERRLVIATILGPQGVRGELRLRVFAEDPATLPRLSSLSLGETGQPVRLVHVRTARDAEIYRMEGINDRDAAAALKGRDLTVARSDLPEPEADSFYHADLVGMTAVAPSGERLGEVVAIANHGAEDLVDLVLDRPVPVFGRTLMLPFRRDFVPEIRLSEGEMVIDLAAWLDLQRGDRR
ncbi:MAG: ribosome maturation factor RimM [Rhodothalassiaceae bacterium]